jgi:uncharacterized protein (DUF934 family)
MRKLLRQREIVQDDWAYFGEDSAEASSSIIVPLAQLRAEPAKWQAWSGRLGVRIGPATRLDEIAADLPRLGVIAIEFPGPAEGRGYTLARLLRERHGYTGEIRAIGAVKRDLVFFMSRCGFDSFELAAGESIEAAQQALGTYSVAYQPSRTLALG